MTSHDGAHAETPRAPAREEESGTISCPKRFAPRAMWPMPAHAQKDSHLAHISLRKDSCPKRFTPRAMGPVQKRLGAHAETPLTTRTTPHCQATKSACWSRELSQLAPIYQTFPPRPTTLRYLCIFVPIGRSCGCDPFLWPCLGSHSSDDNLVSANSDRGLGEFRLNDNKI